jgi:hypothetical protein
MTKNSDLTIVPRKSGGINVPSIYSKSKKKKMLSRCFCLAKQRMQKQNQIELTVQAWRLTFLLLNLVATETHIKRPFSRPSSPTLKSQHGHHHHRRAKRSARQCLLGFDTRSKPQEDYCTRSQINRSKDLWAFLISICKCTTDHGSS